MKAIAPSDSTTFYQLVRDAKIITIAREPECVKNLRLTKKGSRSMPTTWNNNCAKSLLLRPTSSVCQHRLNSAMPRYSSDFAQLSTAKGFQNDNLRRTGATAHTRGTVASCRYYSSTLRGEHCLLAYGEDLVERTDRTQTSRCQGAHSK
jgi:hypothetical protein